MIQQMAIALLLAILLCLPNYTFFATCPANCSTALCVEDGSGHIVSATCTDVMIQDLPNTLVHLTVTDAVSQKTLPLGEFRDFILAGKPSLQVLTINHYGIRQLEGRCFAPCTSLSTLDLKKNLIHSLKAENFDGLINLTYLNLNQNNITKINYNVFNSLASLKQLHMALNSLTEINRKSFHGLIHLERLILQSNKLHNIPHDTFQELVQLTDIDLKDNALTTLVAGVFQGLQHLQTVDLQHNNLHSLDAASMLGVPLTSLNLKHNNFTEIPTDFLVSVSSKEVEIFLMDNKVSELKQGAFSSVTLKTLYLTSNLIKKIQPGAFANCDIEKIDLQQNRLTTLPKTLEQQFSQSEFSLANNLWSCDCEIQWLARILKKISQDKTGQSQISQGLMCVKPHKFNGHRLLDIADELSFECDLIYFFSNILSIPVPPKHSYATPKLNRWTTTVPSTTPVSTAESTITTAAIESTITTAATTELTAAPPPTEEPSKNTNIGVIIGALIGALVVISIITILVLKKFAIRAMKVFPDSNIVCRKPDVNFKQVFKQTDTEI